MLQVRTVRVQRLLARASASAALLLATCMSVAAQQGAPGPIPVGPRIDPEAARVRDEQQREMMLRRRGTEADTAREAERSVKAAAEQLNDDFKRIQVIRNDIAHALKVEGVLDYKRVSGQAAEVRKRALRMQTVLALRDREADERDGTPRAEASGEGDVKGALVRLCKRIDSFVANPRFTAPDVVDVGATARAVRDLREIIALSAEIKASAEKLGGKND